MKIFQDSKRQRNRQKFSFFLPRRISRYFKDWAKKYISTIVKNCVKFMIKDCVLKRQQFLFGEELLLPNFIGHSEFIEEDLNFC